LESFGASCVQFAVLAVYSVLAGVGTWRGAALSQSPNNELIRGEGERGVKRGEEGWKGGRFQVKDQACPGAEKIGLNLHRMDEDNAGFLT
jgi:hypothetical protein